MDTEKCSTHLRQAHEHLRAAAQSAHERVLGKDVARNLRGAARNFLKAGLEALDKADARSAGEAPATETPAPTPTGR